MCMYYYTVKCNGFLAAMRLLVATFVSLFRERSIIITRDMEFTLLLSRETLRHMAEES